MPATPYTYNNFIEGLYADVSLLDIPENALYVQDNCVTSYKLGAILKRPGYKKIGDTLESGKSITGLHNFRQTAAVQKELATINNTAGTNLTLKYNNAGTWTNIALGGAWDGFEDSIVEMEDFITYCFFVGYDSNDDVFLPVGSLTGTTFSTSTNVTDMPQAKYIKRYRDRLYIANCYESGAAQPYRVYFSSVPSAGAITWAPASDFIDVDYSEEITGLGVNWDRLVIFTEYSAYMYNQDEKKKMWDVGCANHRTIRNQGPYMIWADMDNVWMSTGAQPQAIGGRVVDFIRGSNMTNSFAEIVDEEYHLYLGSVTVNGISYSNCSIIFNIPTGTWRVHEYADTMSVYAKFYQSGQDYLHMGTTGGDVKELGKYTDSTLLTDDDGTAIHSWFMTGALDFGNPEVRKSLGKIFAYADRAQGLKLRARVIDRNSIGVSEFENLAELNKYITEVQCNPKDGNFLQIEGQENGSNPYWSLLGLTINVEADTTNKN